MMGLMKHIRPIAQKLGFFIEGYEPEYKYVNRALIYRPRDFEIDSKSFYAIAYPVIDARRTLLGHDRLYTLWQAVKNTYQLNLPNAEVGTFRGGSAYFIASALKYFAGIDRVFHVFDTFKGHPDSKIDASVETHHSPGDFNEVDADDVRNYLKDFSKTYVHVGEFSNSAQDLSDSLFGFVHIDVDIYLGALDCLEYFGSRLAQNGVIVLDDYGAKSCPGMAKAVQEYRPHKKGFHMWHIGSSEQLVLTKTA